jgi:hypothetical protein
VVAVEEMTALQSTVTVVLVVAVAVVMQRLAGLLELQIQEAVEAEHLGLELPHLVVLVDRGSSYLNLQLLRVHQQLL